MLTAPGNGEVLPWGVKAVWKEAITAKLQMARIIFRRRVICICYRLRRLIPATRMILILATGGRKAGSLRRRSQTGTATEPMSREQLLPKLTGKSHRCCTRSTDYFTKVFNSSGGGASYATVLELKLQLGYTIDDLPRRNVLSI